MVRPTRWSRPKGATADELPASICALPWVNLSLDVDGTSRPCCKFAHQEPDSPYQLANLRDAPLAEVWNSEGMQRLRRDFRAGVRPAECSTCWDEEAAGVSSYRQTFVEYRGLSGSVDYDDPAPAAPSALDLKLTNACNLKCRICGPVASSLWLQEELAIGEPEPMSFIAQLKANRTYYLSNKVTHDTQNLATMRSWLDGLEYLELTGGEPMMSPENRELVELIASEGQPERVGILFNTNATVIDDRILHHLDDFREVKICLSIDDIGERLEYQRAPAKWSDITANLARYQEVSRPGWTLYAFCSVSVLNVWYLPEYLRWLSAARSRGEIELVLNLVHYPRHFSVQVLPDGVKEALRSRLRSEILEDPATSPSVAESVSRLVSFIEHRRPDDSAEWQDCLSTIRERDAVRGQHFASVFPELAHQIELAGLEEPGTPVDLP